MSKGRFDHHKLLELHNQDEMYLLRPYFQPNNWGGYSGPDYMGKIIPSSRGRVFAEIPQLWSNHCKTEFDII